MPDTLAFDVYTETYSEFAVLVGGEFNEGYYEGGATLLGYGYTDDFTGGSGYGDWVGSFSATGSFAGQPITVELLGGYTGPAGSGTLIPFAPDYAYVTDASLNGVGLEFNYVPIPSIGQSRYFYTTPQTPTPSPTVSIDDGTTGPDKLVFLLSGDPWQGNPQYSLSIDGSVVSTGYVSASHSLGQEQEIDVYGNFSAGTHSVTLTQTSELNDLNGLTRDLYLDSTTLDGNQIPNSDGLPVQLELTTAASQSFTFAAASEPPDPPQPIIVGSGPDTLTLQVSEDAYLGDAQFTIDVNNEQVGGVLTATALHAQGQTQTVEVKGTFGFDNTATVNFLNDAYDGTPQTDRNLYVDGASVSYPEGTAAITTQTIAGAALTLDSQGSQSFSFATPGYTPPSPIKVGIGSDLLQLTVSEDPYTEIVPDTAPPLTALVGALFNVLVDGVVVAQNVSVSPLAVHGTGESQTVDVYGNFAPGPHVASVGFLNDDYDPARGQDLNLYVDGASVDGAAVPDSSLALLSAGTQSFTFNEANSLPPPITIGSGQYTLTLAIAEDAYMGDAQYTIDVNNEQVGGVQTVSSSASQAKGVTQIVNVEGNFAVNNTVTINFLNDAYAGTPDTDRNLYVDQARLNYTGQDDISSNNTIISGSTFALYSQGSQSFSFTTPYGSGTPQAVFVGSGTEDLALSVSEDAYLGDADYTLAVDGQQIGGTLSVDPLAMHGTGVTQTVFVAGNFAVGSHTLSVDFLNDAFAGPGQDRNLYIEGARFSVAAATLQSVGVPNATLALLSGGTQSFTFTVPSH